MLIGEGGDIGRGRMRAKKAKKILIKISQAIHGGEGRGGVGKCGVFCGGAVVG